MSMTRSVSWVFSLISLAFVLLGVGCFGSPEPDAPTAEPVGERAREYLALKQQHEWGAIYDQILDPEMKTKLAREDFLRKRELAFDVLSFDIVKTQENEDRAKVIAEVQAMIPILQPGGGTQLVRKQMQDPQEWVNRDGTWYIELSG